MMERRLEIWTWLSVEKLSASMTQTPWPVPSVLVMRTGWLALPTNRSGEFEMIAEEGANPIWMADERRILYRVPSQGSYFAVDSVTKERWRVAMPDAESARLSPDNRLVYLNRETSEADIWMVEIR